MCKDLSRILCGIYGGKNLAHILKESQKKYMYLG